MFHEGNLATEFGFSRTPVREVLQMLAAQRLVETRAGVGTIAPPLDGIRREKDFTAYIELTRAAAACSEGQRLSRAVQGEVLGHLSTVEMAPDRGLEAEDYVDISGELVEAMGQLVEDPIIRDAMTGAHWRLLRWRASDILQGGPGQSISMKENSAKIAAAVREGDPAKALLVCAGIGTELKDPAQRS